jgi:hypothetical protein
VFGLVIASEELSDKTLVVSHTVCYGCVPESAAEFESPLEDFERLGIVRLAIERDMALRIGLALYVRGCHLVTIVLVQR